MGDLEEQDVAFLERVERAVDCNVQLALEDDNVLFGARRVPREASHLDPRAHSRMQPPFQMRRFAFG